MEYTSVINNTMLFRNGLTAKFSPTNTQYGILTITLGSITRYKKEVKEDRWVDIVYDFIESQN